MPRSYDDDDDRPSEGKYAEPDVERCGEGKCSEGRSSGGTSGKRRRPGGEEEEEEEESILQKAIKYCWGDGFLDVFRKYFRKHAHKFDIIAEGKTEEHDLEYQELFIEYLGIFEGTLEEFIEKEGSDIQTFYTELRAEQGTTDPQMKLFIDCLLASADYDSFFKVMTNEAARQIKGRGESFDQGQVEEEEEGGKGRRSGSSSHK